MNNNKKIIIGVLALLVVMTMGYALFNETVNVGGTANASGDLAYKISVVKGVDPNIKKSDMYALNEGELVGTFDFGVYSEKDDSKITVTDNKILIENNNLLLNDKKLYYTVKVKNTGNIKFGIDYLNQLNFNYNMKGNLILINDSTLDVNKLRDYLAGKKNVINGPMPDPCFINFNEYGNITTLAVLDISDAFGTKRINDEFLNNLTNDNSYVYLLPGEEIYILLFRNDFSFQFSQCVKGADIAFSNSFEIPIKQIND